MIDTLKGSARYIKKVKDGCRKKTLMVSTNHAEYLLDYFW